MTNPPRRGEPAYHLEVKAPRRPHLRKLQGAALIEFNLKHPRDRKGRFIETGGIARMWGGLLVRVLGMTQGSNKRPMVRVEDRKGRTRLYDPAKLTMIARPDGSKPTASKTKVQKADADRDADPKRPNTDQVDVDDRGTLDLDDDQVRRWSRAELDMLDEDDDDPEDRQERFAAEDRDTPDFVASREDPRDGDLLLLRDEKDDTYEYAQVQSVTKDGRPDRIIRFGQGQDEFYDPDRWDAALIPAEDVDKQALIDDEYSRAGGLDNPKPHAAETDAAKVLDRHRVNRDTARKKTETERDEARARAEAKREKNRQQARETAAKKERTPEQQAALDQYKRDTETLKTSAADATDEQLDEIAAAWERRAEHFDRLNNDARAASARDLAQGARDEKADRGSRRRDKTPTPDQEPASPMQQQGDRVPDQLWDASGGEQRLGAVMAYRQTYTDDQGEKADLRELATRWRGARSRMEAEEALAVDRWLADADQDEMRALVDRLQGTARGSVADTQNDMRRIGREITATPDGDRWHPTRRRDNRDTPQVDATVTAGERTPDGAGQADDRADRGEALADVPAEQVRGDDTGGADGVLQGPRRAGAGADGVPGQGVRAEPERDGDGLFPAGRADRAGETAGVRAGDEGTGVPAAGAGGTEPGVVRHPPRRADAPRFQPQSQADLAPKGKKEKARANIEALRTLQTLQAEDRAATPDEQAKLARWSGWGAIAQEMFSPNPRHERDYAQERANLAELMTPAQLKDAELNAVNAHYTDAGIVDAIWDGMRDLGFTGGSVLEPGSGSGNFIGRAPADADMVGVEREPITAAISQHLYPDATIRSQSFADFDVPDGTFDAAIGNVPFSRELKLVDRKHNPGTRLSIHNHFTKKSVAQTRPGGLVGIITSSATMDSSDSKHRDAIYDMADLVGAIRMPNGAHKDAAGTDVVTDLLIFRRRMPGEKPADGGWVNSQARRTPSGDVVYVNPYWEKNPSRVLGRMEIMGKGAGTSVSGVRVTGDTDRVPDNIRSAMRGIVNDAAHRGLIGTPGEDRAPAAVHEILNSITDRNEGNITFDAAEDVFTVVEAGRVTRLDVPKARRVEAKMMVDLRDAVFALLNAEAASDEDTPEIRKLRKNLGALHTKYTNRYGAVSRTKWRKGIADAAFDDPRTVPGGELVEGAIVEVPGQWGQGGRPRRAHVTDITDDGRIFAQLIGKNAQGNDEKDKSVTLDVTRDYTQTGNRTTTYTQVPKTPPVMDRDPTMAVVRALDLYDINDDPDEKGKRGWSPASILSKRAVKAKTRPSAVDNPADALRLSRNETGKVDIGRVAQLLGVDEPQALTALGDAVYEDVDGGGWQSAEEYLSGDTREKLRRARRAAAENPRYTRNVAALDAVTPDDLTAEDVDGRLGAVWIEEDTVTQFLRESLGDSQVQAVHLGGTRWTVKEGPAGDLNQTQGSYGTDKRDAYRIAENLLTGRPIRISRTVIGPDGGKKSVLDKDATKLAQTRADALAKRFKEWLWEDPERADYLLTRYNDRFNSLVPRDYDGSPYEIDGLADGWTLKPHQAAAVRRIVSERAALLAHEVGAGKTLAMAASAMELRRLGLANKPSIVVPNHMKEQFTREFLVSFPQAKVLAASTEDINTPRKRAEFMAKVATGDWDAVVLTQTAFEKIPMSKDSQRAYLEKEVALLEQQIQKAKAAVKPGADPGKDKTVKQLAAALEKRRQKLLDKITKQEDKGLTFEQTGIDYLFVDEAHQYKNLEVVSSLRDAAIPGADRATDLHMKVDYLQTENPTGPTVTFATATPVANAVAEAYTLMRYLRPDMLHEQGIEDFDSWRNTFGEIVQEPEPTVAGGAYRQKERLSRFKNTPEMLRTFQAVADVQTGEDLDLDVPDIDGGAAEAVIVQPDQWLLEEKIPELVDRAENLSGVDPTEDNMLKIMGEARAAALDPRLVGGPEPENGGKVAKAAEEIAAIYEETKGNRYGFPGDTDMEGALHPTAGALQVVFCDLGTPGGRKKKKKTVLDEDGNEVEVEVDEVSDEEAGLVDFNVYDALKERLVEQGVPAEKIAYMQDAKGNDAKKAELFRRARTGEIAVLIGSTQLMGVGTNVQDRAVAIHHMDPPWRPADVQQRDGRVIRQKNQNSVVRVKQYGVKGSLDTMMWQTLERKAKFISQMLKGNLEDREFEDIGGMAMTAGEMKAAFSGDMTLMHKAKTDALLNKLELAQSAWRSGQQIAKNGVTQSRGNIARHLRNEEAFDTAIAQRVLDDDLLGGMPFTIGGRGNKDFENATELNEWVRDQVLDVLKSQKMMGDGEKQQIGEIAGGFKVYAQSLYDPNRGRGVAVWVAGVPDASSGWMAASDVQNRQWFTRWSNLMRDLERRKFDTIAAREQAERKLRMHESQDGKTFDQADELDAVRKRAGRINALMVWRADGPTSDDDKAAFERWKEDNPEAAAAGGKPPPPPELLADAPEVDAVLGPLDEEAVQVERTPSRPLVNVDDAGVPAPRDTDYLRRAREGKTGVNRPGSRKGAKAKAKAAAAEDAGPARASGGRGSGSDGRESDRPRNPQFGKPAADPELRRYGSSRTGTAQVVQQFHGRYEDSKPIERTLWTVSREDGVWSVFRPQQQVPDRSFGSRKEAEDWALERANLPDLDAGEPTLLDQAEVADTIEDLGGDRPAERTPDTPAAPATPAPDVEDGGGPERETTAPVEDTTPEPPGRPVLDEADPASYLDAVTADAVDADPDVADADTPDEPPAPDPVPVTPPVPPATETPDTPNTPPAPDRDEPWRDPQARYGRTGVGAAAEQADWETLRDMVGRGNNSMMARAVLDRPDLVGVPNAGLTRFPGAWNDVVKPDVADRSNIPYETRANRLDALARVLDDMAEEATSDELKEQLGDMAAQAMLMRSKAANANEWEKARRQGRAKNPRPTTTPASVPAPRPVPTVEESLATWERQIDGFDGWPAEKQQGFRDEYRRRDAANSPMSGPEIERWAAQWDEDNPQDADEALVVDARGAEGQQEGQQALGGGDVPVLTMLQEEERAPDGPSEAVGQTDIFGAVDEPDTSAEADIPQTDEVSTADEAPVVSYPTRDALNPTVRGTVDEQVRRNIADGSPYPEMHDDMSPARATAAKYMRDLARQYDGPDAEALRAAAGFLSDRTRKSPVDLARELVYKNRDEKYRTHAELDAVLEQHRVVADALDRAYRDGRKPHREGRADSPLSDELREYVDEYQRARGLATDREAGSVGGEVQDDVVPESDSTPATDRGLTYAPDVRYVHVDQWGRDRPDENTVVWNAPRPLAGADTWKGDFVSGIFYASARRDDPDFDRWAELNRRDGAVEVQVIDNAQALALHDSAAEQQEGASRYTLKDYLDNDLSPAEALQRFNLPWSDDDDSAAPLIAKLREGDTGQGATPDVDTADAPEGDTPEPDVTPDETPEPAAAGGGEQPPRTPPAGPVPGDAEDTPAPDGDVPEQAEKPDARKEPVIGQSGTALDDAALEQGQRLMDDAGAKVKDHSDEIGPREIPQIDTGGSSGGEALKLVTDPSVNGGIIIKKARGLSNAEFSDVNESLRRNGFWFNKDRGGWLHRSNWPRYSDSGRYADTDATAVREWAAGAGYLGADGGAQKMRTDPMYEEYAPTDQQAWVGQGFFAGARRIVAGAMAGTGKTTTLVALARRIKMAQPDRRGIHLAFNKSVAEDVVQKMPDNVAAVTGDALAWNAMAGKGKPMASKWRRRDLMPGKPGALIKNYNDIGRFLGLTDLTHDGRKPGPRDNPEDIWTAGEQARDVQKIVEKFAISADDEIGPQHLPDEIAGGGDRLLDAARRYWADLNDPDGDLFITNSHITKMWALTRPDLTRRGAIGGLVPRTLGITTLGDDGFIFFDEAQDINTVMGRVIADQKAQVIYVGDPNQAIYGFRGASDEMSRVDADHTAQIDVTHRFGEGMTDPGNRFMQLTGSPNRVVGAGDGGEVLEPGSMPVETADAVLSRSNAGAIAEILAGQEAGRLVGVPKGVKGDLRNLVLTARWMREPDKYRQPNVIHEDLAPFRNWREFEKAVEKTGDPKLTMLQRIVTEYDDQALLDMVEQLIDLSDGADTRKPDLTVSTAHKAKGLEWGRVKIADDFRGVEITKDGRWVWPDDEEMRLAYVALTRGMKAIDPGSLAWVYQYTDANGGRPGSKPSGVPDEEWERLQDRPDRAKFKRMVDAVAPDVPVIDETSTDEQVADALDEGDVPEVTDPAGYLDEVTDQAEADDPDLAESPRRGEVGGMYAAGEVVLTASGRETTPFPKVDMSTPRKTTATLKRVDKWLIDNAKAEADSRGLPEWTINTDVSNLSPADKDTAERVLFDPEWLDLTPKPSPLKPLVQPRPDSDEPVNTPDVTPDVDETPVDVPAAPEPVAAPPAPEPELVATPVRRTPRANNDRVVDVTRDGDVWGTVEAVMDPDRPKKVDHHRVLRGDTEVGTLHKSGKSRHRAQRVDGTWLGGDGTEDGARKFENRNQAALALLEDAGHTTPEPRGDVELPTDEPDTAPDETLDGPDGVVVADTGVITPPGTDPTDEDNDFITDDEEIDPDSEEAYADLTDEDPEPAPVNPNARVTSEREYDIEVGSDGGLQVWEQYPARDDGTPGYRAKFADLEERADGRVEARVSAPYHGTPVFENMDDARVWAADPYNSDAHPWDRETGMSPQMRGWLEQVPAVGSTAGPTRTPTGSYDVAEENGLVERVSGGSQYRYYPTPKGLAAVGRDPSMPEDNPTPGHPNWEMTEGSTPVKGRDVRAGMVVTDYYDHFPAGEGWVSHVEDRPYYVVRVQDTRTGGRAVTLADVRDGHTFTRLVRAHEMDRDRFAVDEAATEQAPKKLAKSKRWAKIEGKQEFGADPLPMDGDPIYIGADAPEVDAPGEPDAGVDVPDDADGLLVRRALAGEFGPDAQQAAVDAGGDVWDGADGEAWLASVHDRMGDDLPEGLYGSLGGPGGDDTPEVAPEVPDPPNVAPEPAQPAETVSGLDEYGDPVEVTGQIIGSRPVVVNVPGGKAKWTQHTIRTPDGDTVTVLTARDSLTPPVPGAPGTPAAPETGVRRGMRVTDGTRSGRVTDMIGDRAAVRWDDDTTSNVPAADLEEDTTIPSGGGITVGAAKPGDTISLPGSGATGTVVASDGDGEVVVRDEQGLPHRVDMDPDEPVDEPDVAPVEIDEPARPVDDGGVPGPRSTTFGAVSLGDDLEVDGVRGTLTNITPAMTGGEPGAELTLVDAGGVMHTLQVGMDTPIGHHDTGGGAAFVEALERAHRADTPDTPAPDPVPGAAPASLDDLADELDPGPVDDTGQGTLDLGEPTTIPTPGGDVSLGGDAMAGFRGLTPTQARARLTGRRDRDPDEGVLPDGSVEGWRRMRAMLDEDVNRRLAQSARDSRPFPGETQEQAAARMYSVITDPALRARLATSRLITGMPTQEPHRPSGTPQQQRRWWQRRLPTDRDLVGTRKGVTQAGARVDRVDINPDGTPGEAGARHVDAITGVGDAIGQEIDRGVAGQLGEDGGQLLADLADREHRFGRRYRDTGDEKDLRQWETAKAELDEGRERVQVARNAATVRALEVLRVMGTNSLRLDGPDDRIAQIRQAETMLPADWTLDQGRWLIEVAGLLGQAEKVRSKRWRLAHRLARAGVPGDARSAMFALAGQVERQNKPIQQAMRVFNARRVKEGRDILSLGVLLDMLYTGDRNLSARDRGFVLGLLAEL